MIPTISARPQRTRRLTRRSPSRAVATLPAADEASRSDGEAGAIDMSGTTGLGQINPIGTKLRRNQSVIYRFRLAAAFSGLRDQRLKLWVRVTARIPRGGIATTD